MARKLIEVALPLEAINKAAAREKSIRHGHPSTLHLWWARRPLAAARAVLFAQLVDDPSTWPELAGDEAAQKRERERLFQLIEDMVPWEATQDPQILREARREIARSHARFHREIPRAGRMLEADVSPEEVDAYLATELPPVHDPFAGGGTIPLEAQRLGLRAIASDLNPVAVLINKALIEIPPKFAGKPPVNPESRRKAGLRTWKGAEGLAEDVRYYGKWMRDEAFKRIGHLYPRVKLPAEHGGGEATVIAWLWARTVQSPDPRFAGVHVPLVNSFWLSTKPNKRTWIEVVRSNSRDYRFEVKTGSGDPPVTETINRQGGTCILSGASIPFEYIREQGRMGCMGERLMAIVVEGKGSRIYCSPTADLEASCKVDVPRDRPTELQPSNTRDFRMPNYGLRTFGDLFTPRQTTSLLQFSKLILETHEQVTKDSLNYLSSTETSKYVEAISVYLTFAFDKMVEASTTICSWSSAPKNELVISTFRRQALPMTWDFAESNPFADSSGSFEKSLLAVARVLESLDSKCGGQAIQQDAATSHSTDCLVSTDPPYYDNVGYADLSDFFYLWQRRILSTNYPDLYRTMLVPKSEELVASPYRFEGSKEKAAIFFENGMGRAVHAIHNEQNADWPVAIYYAFKQSESDTEGTTSTGWETFLDGVMTAGFLINGTWPMRTERSGRMNDIGANALASSIVIVCRKRPADAPTATRSEFLRALKRTLPRDLKLLQQGNIAPVDFAQAAIGPGMAVFSAYAKVLESDGSALRVRTALQLINQVLDEVLSEQEGDFDGDTRWALAWFEQYQYADADYGLAETLSKAKVTSVAGLVDAGILLASRGKVRLRTRAELDAAWDPATDARLTVWEIAQHLIRVLEAGGESAAAALLARVGPKADAARELAYRLYSLCERKKWAQEALGYNALVTAWPELSRIAAGLGTAPGTSEPQGTLAGVE